MDRVRSGYELDGVVQQCIYVEQKREKGILQFEVSVDTKESVFLKDVCILRNLSLEPIGEPYVDNSYRLTVKGHRKQCYKLTFLEPFPNDDWCELFKNIQRLKATIGEDNEFFSDYFESHLCNDRYREKFKQACDALHWTIQFFDDDTQIDRKGRTKIRVEIKRV